MNISLRKASFADVPALEVLIDASVRELQKDDYNPAQIDSALRTVFTVDSQLIQDGTYFIAERDGEIVGCGGWSRRRTLCGGDHHAVRDNVLLDPKCDPAKIRAIFVDPRHARKGIGSMILKTAEDAAIAEGFSQLEMASTLSGVPLYLLRGYRVVERSHVPLESGVSLPVIRMAKAILS